jgi:hypothetical protein
MGMFDSFYATPGYEYEHEWQVKAYGCVLDTWHVGDRLPDDHPTRTYQVEVIGGSSPGERGASRWSFATVVDGVLVAVPVDRDPSLPLIAYSGGLLEDGA